MHGQQPEHNHGPDDVEARYPGNPVLWTDVVEKQEKNGGGQFHQKV
jgi:hypothetical protein